MKYLILIATLLSLTACLQTRNKIKETATVTPAERERAQEAARYMDYEEQIRTLNGRIEELANTIQQMSEAKNHRDVEREEMKQEFDERLKTYAESIAKMEAEMAQLRSQSNAMVAGKQAAQNAKAQANPFANAEALFTQKKWREAIVSYQSYRDRYPDGSNYSEATYKMGVAFQELGMKDEAKAFYNEAVKKFPKSKAAEKSQYRLKNI